MPPPRRIDRYEVRELLGAGTFGSVYRAYDPRLDRDVALKVLRPEMTDSPQAVERFVREAKAAGKLLHPHIVPVFDTGRAGEVYFIASAFIQGRTLASAILEGGMEPRRAAELAAQLASALGYAHKQGVLHRDVKPANAMLDDGGSLHLMDFGLAGWTQETTTRLTRLGAVIGTPAYMAPEQADGDTARVGPASDVYSAGVVLYELLTGRLPFDRGHPVALGYHIINVAPPPPSQHRPGLDAGLEAICLKAMAKDPTRRFASGEEMAAALTAWAPTALPLAQPMATPGKADPPPTVWGRILVDESAERRPRSVRDRETVSPASAQATILPPATPRMRGRSGTDRRGRPDWSWVFWAVLAVLVGLSAVAVLVCLVPPHRPPALPSAEAKPSPRPVETTTTGKVIGVDKGTLTAFVDGEERTFIVLATAKVLINAKDGQLADIKKDSPVTVTTKDDVVVTVEIKSPPPPGWVVAPFDAAAARRLQQAWADFLGVPVVREVDLGGGVVMKLVLIPPGSFQMGSADPSKGWTADEKPQHNVTITKPFYFGAFPVTQAEYVQVTGQKNPSWFSNDGGGRNGVIGLDSAEFPVESVTWDEAESFCEALNGKDAKRPAAWKYALPTEAQWEYACRAGTTTAYFFGDDPNELGDYAWYDGNSEGRTHAVGTRKPNAWGLYDMHGDVLQWCADYYDPKYYNNTGNKDPQNLSKADVRVLRGGSWSHYAGICRAAYRGGSAPAIRDNFIGYRVCLCLD